MKKPRILIVDDNHKLTDLWRRLLERIGKFDIWVESNGDAALRTAQSFRPEMIFLDLCLSGRDGGEIAAELAADPILQSTPIVFVTGLSPEEVAERHLPAHHMVLEKPMEWRGILTCAERLFDVPASDPLQVACEATRCAGADSRVLAA